MAQRRYLLVKGVAGVAVPDTRAPAQHGQAKRFLGHELSPDCRAGNDGKCTTHADPDHILEHYVPVQQLLVDSIDVRRAIEHGGLTLLGEAIAKNHDAAADAIAAKAAEQVT